MVRSASTLPQSITLPERPERGVANSGVTTECRQRRVDPAWFDMRRLFGGLRKARSEWKLGGQAPGLLEASGGWMAEGGQLRGGGIFGSSADSVCLVGVWRGFGK
jgi:hypothetical protein